MQEELDAAQDAAGSFWSQAGAWFFGHDGGVAGLSGAAAAHDGLSLRLQRHLTERQLDRQPAGTVGGQSDETLDDLLRRLG